MKYPFFFNLKISLFTIVSLNSIGLLGQRLHIDYIQTEGSPTQFSVEVWVSSNAHNESIYLSALNTVFEYSNNVFDNRELTFKLAPKFSSMSEPITNVVQNQSKLRSTMVPVKSPDYAVQLSNKPELFGILTLRSKTSIDYPQVISPSTTGNPTLQALVYEGESVNSTALTLSQLSITTDENPLVLKLMPTQVNVKPTWHEVDIYPNPTTNLLYYQIGSETRVEVEEISMLDAQGRVVMRLIEPGKQEGTIDMTNVAPGMYYLMVKQGETISRHKIIKI